MKLPEYNRIQLVWALKAFLKKPSENTWGIFNLSRNQLSIVTGLPTGHYHLKGHPFKLRLVNSPQCDGCKQASEMASHVLCDSVARLGHLAHHFTNPGDFEDICVSKILHFVQCVGLLNG